MGKGGVMEKRRNQCSHIIFRSIKRIIYMHWALAQAFGNPAKLSLNVGVL
jgi:hypothetical protein